MIILCIYFIFLPSYFTDRLSTANIVAYYKWEISELEVHYLIYTHTLSSVYDYLRSINAEQLKLTHTLPKTNRCLILKNR